MAKDEKKSPQTFLIVMMIGAYALAIGTVINAVFSIFLGGKEGVSMGQRLIVALCFFGAATIFRMLARRNS